VGGGLPPSAAHNKRRDFMQSIRFDDGYKEFMINDDPSRVIRFNPADYGILERFNVAQKEITKEVENLQADIDIKPDGSPDVPMDELEEAAKMLGQVRKLICDQVDYIFGSPVSDAAFGTQSPLSSVKGLPLFERFIRAAQPFIEKEVKAEQLASQKRINKYTKQVKQYDW
jgi:hypothetical protein